MFARTFILDPSRVGPRSLRLLSSLLIAGALACGGGGGDTPTNPGNPGNPGGTPAPVATTSVNLQSNAFSPADIQVSPGATVTFTNLDGYAHTVTFDNTSISSIGSYSSGAQTVTMPTATGTYAYHCQIHGSMKGTVVVK
jgi:plastocyanin